MGLDVKKYPHYTFWTKEGDETKLSTQDITVEAQGPLKIKSD